MKKNECQKKRGWGKKKKKRKGLDPNKEEGTFLADYIRNNKLVKKNKTKQINNMRQVLKKEGETQLLK